MDLMSLLLIVGYGVVCLGVGAMIGHRLRKKDPNAYEEAAAIFKAGDLTPEQLERLRAKLRDLASGGLL